ncbi:unnamed protein product [Owenia fusiformis]|uniref:asparaginase n=1 Tax=Owenia fusiformis TaxID=6347 RepID=A0A8J1UGU9_OWEFU|nr:unnamed protein product [Owenia fusiformis]
MAANFETGSFKNGEINGPVSPVDPSYTPKLLHTTSVSIDKIDGDRNHESRILCLFTGGTIGMTSNHDGVYVPKANFLVKELRKLPMFHDDSYNLLGSDLNDPERPLVMPLSKDGKRVVYCVYEYEPLLDSCNMTMDDWARLAMDVKKNYELFDGFVILHGTDTMAYTASALSFMLENLGKPVIVTGSQIPIFETRSDGRDNFLGALIIAGHYNIPEVTLYFNNKLLRGNRATKVDSGSFDAFDSPNLRPLVQMQIGIHVRWDQIFRSGIPQAFSVHTDLCPHVGILRLFPSITADTVKAFLSDTMQGVVLQTYGAGNGPDSRKDLMEVFTEASERGVLIINTTQCSRGVVATSYATGKALLDAGVIPGSDMTPEAALSKLSYVLGKSEWDMAQKRQMLNVNLRGEMKVATVKQKHSLLDFSLIQTLAETMKLSSKEEIHLLRSAIFPSLMCSAAKNGDVDGLIKLKTHGANVNEVDYDNRSALHLAATEGQLEAVEYLLKEGGMVHMRDRFGNTPLRCAIMYNHPDIIRILRKAGAHITINPVRIGVELCSLAAINDLEGLRSWYLAGANINSGDYDKRTALHVAVTFDYLGIVTFLLECGARSDIKDMFGNTALTEATTRGLDKIVAVLSPMEDR